MAESPAAQGFNSDRAFFTHLKKPNISLTWRVRAVSRGPTLALTADYSIGSLCLPASDTRCNNAPHKRGVVLEQTLITWQERLVLLDP